MAIEMAGEQDEQRSPCPACGGSGQLNFFKGESRFLLSVEECPACCGFGYMQNSVQEDESEKPEADSKKTREEKKERSERKG